MSRRKTTLSISFVLLFAIACDDAPKAHIRGVVQDAFERPLAGVQVRIVDSEFAAVSDQAGNYALPFAPGSFKVKYGKKGFTSEIVPLSLSEETDFSAEAVALFPSPQEGGVFALGEEGLVELPLREIERFEQRGTLDEGIRYYVKSLDELPVLAPGRSRFIDSDETDQRLARVTEHGLVYEVSTRYGSSEETYADFVKDTVELAGEEELEVRTAKLRRGVYCWIEMQRGTVTSRPGSHGYMFRVDSGNRPDDGERRLSWLEAARSTMRDMLLIAKAWEARATDINTYWVDGVDEELSPLEIEGALVPTYLGRMPATDGWSQSFRFIVDSGGQRYVIASSGADELRDTEDDVVYSNGRFIQYPEGVRVDEIER